MGSGKNEIKEVTILVRTVRWTAEGLEYEADVRHRRRIMEAEGLDEDSKAVPSTAVKEDNGKAELDEKDSDADDHRRFRSEGTTLNCLLWKPFSVSRVCNVRRTCLLPVTFCPSS